MTGKQFGFLTVIGRSGSKRGLATWLCQCECGAQIVVSGYLLRRGSVQSCGCKKCSIREALIDKELSRYSVSFAKEITFKDLLGKSGVRLRFDFGVYDEHGQ